MPEFYTGTPSALLTAPGFDPLPLPLTSLGVSMRPGTLGIEAVSDAWELMGEIADRVEAGAQIEAFGDTGGVSYALGAADVSAIPDDQGAASFSVRFSCQAVDPVYDVPGGVIDIPRHVFSYQSPNQSGGGYSWQADVWYLIPRGVVPGVTIRIDLSEYTIGSVQYQFSPASHSAYIGE